MPWHTGVLQEFLKHASPDYLATGTDLFSLRAQVANTRPEGRIPPSILFYPAQHLVSTQRQRQAPCPWLRSSYIYTVLKLFRPFEGNRKTDVAPGENEFDTPALDCQI